MEVWEARTAETLVAATARAMSKEAARAACQAERVAAALTAA